MPKTLTLMFATAAITAVIGIPAWSAMHAASPGGNPLIAIGDAGAEAVRLILVDDDEDDNGNAVKIETTGKESEDASECEDEDSSCGAAQNPAPAGTVAPPKNGLVGTATPPKAQVN